MRARFACGVVQCRRRRGVVEEIRDNRNQTRICCCAMFLCGEYLIYIKEKYGELLFCQKSMSKNMNVRNRPVLSAAMNFLYIFAC